MLEFQFRETAEIVFTPEDCLLNIQKSKWVSANKALREIFKRLDFDICPIDRIDILSSHPLANLLVEYTKGLNLPSDRARKALVSILTLGDSWIQARKAGIPCVEQSAVLLPGVDTRGAEIRIFPMSEDTPQVFHDRVITLRRILGEDWGAFVSPLTTVTFVTVPSMPNLPYFSGSSSDLWGSFHMIGDLNPYVICECLTHEAAHLWLNLCELVDPIAENMWTDDSWISPWREDLRPLGGVIHGAFVFSCVAVTLASLSSKQGDLAPGGPNQKRLAKLIAQVEESLNTLRESSRLTVVGKNICDASEARLASLRLHVDEDTLQTARRDCIKRYRQKTLTLGRSLANLTD